MLAISASISCAESSPCGEAKLNFRRANTKYCASMVAHAGKVLTTVSCLGKVGRRRRRTISAYLFRALRQKIEADPSGLPLSSPKPASAIVSASRTNDYSKAISSHLPENARSAKVLAKV